MKKKIAGLVLLVMAVAIAALIFILPEYIPSTNIWQTIFTITFYSGAGLAAGISISLVIETTAIEGLFISLVNLIAGFLISLSFLFISNVFSTWVVLIAISLIVALLTSAVVFFNQGFRIYFLQLKQMGIEEINNFCAFFIVCEWP